jgi:predicted NBD/HSP70 family sugar kinase
MALRGTNQEFGRPYNRRIVLEAIRLHGPLTRADIARRVGLTPQTVANIVREIEVQGFILSERGAPKGRGYPAAALALNPEGGFAIGIHATPRGLEAALVNLAGSIVARARRDLPRIDPDTAFREIGAMVPALAARRPDGRMLGVGLAMPGPFDVESMSFVGPTTLEGWKGVPVRQALTTVTGLPSFLEVDLAAAAHGEQLYGVGRDLRTFYYLYFGVGLGGSMVHDGAALRGAWGNAGEIGHMIAVPGGDPCPCGNCGCLERYVSLEAYERRSATLGEDVWLAEAAPLFRTTLLAIENLFDPETVVVGGLAERPLLERLVAATTPLANSVAARRDRRAPRITFSSLGQDAVLLGAAALAVSGVLSPRFGMLFAEGPRPAARDPILEAAEAHPA